MSSNIFGIAISGFSGCGNTTVSRMVADLMNLKWINYTFRNIAEEDGIDFQELCRLADESDEYDYRVDRTQVKLARDSSSVLGSRLAIWMLEKADLKVFLTASLSIRAKRIQHREGGSIEKQITVTAQRDARDRKRYNYLYNIDTMDYTHADLIVNTDQFEAKEVAVIIQNAAVIIRSRTD